MADYTNLDQVLRDRKGTLEQRQAFVRGWLQDTYDIDYDLNPAYFDELTRPHDHDNEPLHYGRVQLPSVLGTVYAELVKNATKQWRIAVSTAADMRVRTTLLPVKDPNAETTANDLATYVLSLSTPEQPVMATGPVEPLGQYEDLQAYSNGSASQEDGATPVPPHGIPYYLITNRPNNGGIPIDVSAYL